METLADVPVQVPYRGTGNWFSLAAGAVVTVGISLTLTTFGAAIGLSVISTTTTWRDSSSWLWLCSGLYLVFVALWAFGLGGYVAGRLRRPSTLDVRDMSFRDGLHGVATWGLALLLSAMVAAFVATTARPQSQASQTAPSTTAETLIPAELDRLFRDARHPGDPAFAYHRAEAGRILLQTSSKNGISNDDRDYLTALVVSETGFGPGLAATRVDQAIAQSRDAIHKARVAAVLQAFMIAAGLALGAAISWFAAVEGGKERDRGDIPEWGWTRRHPA